MDVKFHRLEIHGVKNLGDRVEVVPDAEADMFCVYGLVTAVNGSEFAICIGDYPTKPDAELIAELLGI